MSCTTRCGERIVQLVFDDTDYPPFRTKLATTKVSTIKNNNNVSTTKPGMMSTYTCVRAPRCSLGSEWRVVHAHAKHMNIQEVGYGIAMERVVIIAGSCS